MRVFDGQKKRGEQGGDGEAFTRLAEEGKGRGACSSLNEGKTGRPQ